MKFPEPKIRAYRPADEQAVISLWERCGLVMPWNDPRRDIETKLSSQAELFLVSEIGTRVAGTVMAGFDGHRGWVYYLGVDPDRRGHGIGRQLMQAVESRLQKLGCPKINLQIRDSNHQVVSFYERLGFRVEDLVSMGRRID